MRSRTRWSSTTVSEANSALARWLLRLCGWVYGLGGILMAALALLICADVAARLFLGQPFNATTELARNGLVAYLYMQLPLVIHEQRLLRVTFLKQRLSRRSQRVLNALASAVGLAVFAVLLYEAWQPIVEAFRYDLYEGSAAFRMPVGPVRVVAFVLWSLCAGVCLLNLLSVPSGTLSDQPDQSGGA